MKSRRPVEVNVNRRTESVHMRQVPRDLHDRLIALRIPGTYVRFVNQASGR